MSLGSGTRLNTNNRQIWHQDTPGVFDCCGLGVNAETFDIFGLGLACSDFNGDLRDDLAIGVMGESLPMQSEMVRQGGPIEEPIDAGLVHVISGTIDGLSVLTTVGGCAPEPCEPPSDTDSAGARQAQRWGQGIVRY